MTTMERFVKTLLLLVVGLSLFSCTRDDSNAEQASKMKTTAYKIAVVLPLSQSDNYKKRIDNTVDWALENLRNAQQKLAAAGDTNVISLDIEWYDENKVNLAELGAKLTRRDSILLIVGPQKNEDVNILAPLCKKADKPLIVPSASSEDVIRRYAVTKSGDKAENPFLWSLCESDVAQSNILVAKAWEGGAKNIALLTPDNTYGKTFYDWVPYMAVNMGVQLETKNLIQYTQDNLAEKAREAMQSGVGCLICAAETPAEVKTILEAKNNSGSNVERILFTDAALSSSLTELDNLSKEGVEGIAHYANPSTGFKTAYKERFNQFPASFEAQLYDAILLSGITAFEKKHFPDGVTDANEIIRGLTAVGETPLVVWNEQGLYELLQLLSKGEYAKMTGASGLLRFDRDAYTSIVESTYIHWRVYNDQFTALDFITTSGTGGTTSAMAAWNWAAQNAPELEDEDAPVQYNTLKDKWAVLVQGSSGWEDYRHQADVLNVYQLLKRNGWPDDHIILIISDDIANDPKNITPGEVRANLNGPELYKTAKIDYSTDSLTVADFKNILWGKQSSHLPTVLNTTDQSDILLFWSGHGISETSTLPNCFYWRSDKTIYSETEFRETLQKMFDEKRYRKMLLLLEPCHSRNLAKQTDHMPGMMAFAAANGNESSFADYHSSMLGIWMSDRFTNNLVNTLSDKPGQTYKELYEYLYKHTLGSHVYFENAGFFGNLFKDSPKEFIVYN